MDFEEYVRSGTAPVPANNSLSSKHRNSPNHIETTAIPKVNQPMRPKTRSSGDDGDLSELNAALRQNKISSKKDSTDDDEYSFVFENFRDSIESFQGDSSQKVDTLSRSKAGAKRYNGSHTSNTISNNPNSGYSAYTQNVPNIVLQARKLSKSSNYSPKASARDQRAVSAQRNDKEITIDSGKSSGEEASSNFSSFAAVYGLAPKAVNSPTNKDKSSDDSRRPYTSNAEVGSNMSSRSSSAKRSGKKPSSSSSHSRPDESSRKTSKLSDVAPKRTLGQSSLFKSNVVEKTDNRAYGAKTSVTPASRRHSGSSSGDHSENSQTPPPTLKPNAQDREGLDSHDIDLNGKKGGNNPSLVAAPSSTSITSSASANLSGLSPGSNSEIGIYSENVKLERPQSRKLYLRADVNHSSPRTALRAPLSAGTRAKSLFVDSDDNSLETPPRIRKLSSFSSLSSDDHWSQEIPLDRPPSRQKSAFPVHLAESEDDNIDNGVGFQRPPSRQKIRAQHLFDEGVRTYLLNENGSSMTNSEALSAVSTTKVMKEPIENPSRLVSQTAPAQPSTKRTSSTASSSFYHDPIEDGFAVLDSIDQSPFRIEVNYDPISSFGGRRGKSMVASSSNGLLYHPLLNNGKTVENDNLGVSLGGSNLPINVSNTNTENTNRLSDTNNSAFQARTLKNESSAHKSAPSNANNNNNNNNRNIVIDYSTQKILKSNDGLAGKGLYDSEDNSQNDYDYPVVIQSQDSFIRGAASAPASWEQGKLNGRQRSIPSSNVQEWSQLEAKSRRVRMV